MTSPDSNEELEGIIRQGRLTPVFQPIFDLSAVRLLGYEALIRGPADTSLHSPINLFQAAARARAVPALEYACREVSCRHFLRQGLEGKLFLNVSPASLLASNHENGVTTRILSSLGMPADRVVIELSEQYPFEDYDIIRAATEHYRRMGFEIAIDDLGAGYSGLKVWSHLRPEYVKVDRHFVENIHADPVKREFVRSIQEISRSLGCKVIAEGVETEEELNVIRSIGICYGQGYLLGRPLTMPARSAPACLRREVRGSPFRHALRRPQVVSNLLETTAALAESVSLEHAADIFQQNLSLFSIPVVRDQRPIGIVVRRHILELFLGRYVRELFAKRPISEFMHKSPVIIESRSSLEEASRLITNDPDMDMGMEFIIVEDGVYRGTGKIHRLLQMITDNQIRSARYSNPLTLLPGNVPVYEILDDLLDRKLPFHIAYFDINDFKPYNDKYGYSRGDEVIVKLGEILAAQVSPEHDFLGHIGGDDFLAIYRSEDWEQRCRRVIGEFRRHVPTFYNEEDLKRGGIRSVDRRGHRRLFPLLSLAAGVVSPDLQRCVSHHDVAALAADAKHMAKREGGDSLFISRRRGGQSPGDDVPVASAAI